MRPTPRTLLRRRIGAVLALCYLVVAVLVPLAHAALERTTATAHAETHMHAPGQDCPPAHNEEHCPACHFAGLKTLHSGSALAVADAQPRSHALALGEAFSPPRHPVRTPGPRGPPSA